MKVRLIETIFKVKCHKMISFCVSHSAFICLREYVFNKRSNSAGSCSRADMYLWSSDNEFCFSSQPADNVFQLEEQGVVTVATLFPPRSSYPKTSYPSGKSCLFWCKGLRSLSQERVGDCIAVSVIVSGRQLQCLQVWQQANPLLCHSSC